MRRFHLGGIRGGIAMVLLCGHILGCNSSREKKESATPGLENISQKKQEAGRPTEEDRTKQAALLDGKLNVDSQLNSQSPTSNSLPVLQPGVSINTSQAYQGYTLIAP